MQTNYGYLFIHLELLIFLIVRLEFAANRCHQAPGSYFHMLTMHSIRCMKQQRSALYAPSPCMPFANGTMRRLDCRAMQCVNDVSCESGVRSSDMWQDLLLSRKNVVQ